jgi:hypothetical protein
VDMMIDNINKRRSFGKSFISYDRVEER